jgi:hypothetical protein
MVTARAFGKNRDQPQHISNIEHGNKEICAENLGRLARASSVTISELMKGL